MSAPTPGPWVVGSWCGACKKSHDGMRWHPGSAHPTDPCIYEPMFLAGSSGIAGPDGAMVVQSSDDGLQMSAADAHLIAAAPELLAAQTMGAQLNTPDFMDWIADRLVHVHHDNPSADFIRSLRERAQAGRAAVAKATGSAK